MKKGIIPPLLLLLAAIALIIGAFFLLDNKPKTANQITLQTASPSPTDETVYTETTESANWKTYTNNKYRYLFSYEDKNDSELKTCGGNNQVDTGDETVIIKGINIMQSVCILEWYSPITITVEKGKSASGDYYKNDKFLNSLGQGWDINTGKIIIDGIPSIKTNLKMTDQKDRWFGLEFNEVRTYKDGFTYVITQGHAREYNDTFNQILSTFKFTARSQTSDTSNWKTYISEDRKFSMKYPSNWIS